MKIKCEYCGSFISDTDEKCEFCGATNAHLVRKATGIPETIEQLKAFAKQHNLPLEKMRYFLGENYTGAKAIGIYYDEEKENFIVYKNKADGTRAVRYEGKDEAYAVNEVYQKMKSDMNNQKVSSGNRPKNSTPSSNGSGGGGMVKIILYIMIAIVILVILFGRSCGRSCGPSTSSPGTVYAPGYYDSSDDDSSWWGDSDNSGSSWWNSDNNSGSSWNDNWNSSDWNWDSSNSWNSGGSNWNSNW